MAFLLISFISRDFELPPFFYNILYYYIVCIRLSKFKLLLLAIIRIAFIEEESCLLIFSFFSKFSNYNYVIIAVGFLNQLKLYLPKDYLYLIIGTFSVYTYFI